MVPFCLFEFGVSLLTLNIRKKVTLNIKELLRNLDLVIRFRSYVLGCRVLGLGYIIGLRLELRVLKR